jgi:hypothetical protein
MQKILQKMVDSIHAIHSCTHRGDTLEQHNMDVTRESSREAHDIMR